MIYIYVCDWLKMISLFDISLLTQYLVSQVQVEAALWTLFRSVTPVLTTALILPVSFPHLMVVLYVFPTSTRPILKTVAISTCF